MKQESKVISISRGPIFRLDPTFTSEEAIVLRTLAAGKTDQQVCSELRMTPEAFIRTMRNVREKTFSPNDLSLREWARRQMKGLDQRIDEGKRLLWTTRKWRSKALEF